VTASQPDEEALFNAARRIGDGVARARYVREACEGDEALIRRVEALLAVSDGPDRLLDRPAVPTPGGDETRTGPDAAEDADVPLDFLAPSNKPGSLGRLDHYEIQEVVGRGGMGVVLKAFDEKLHRVVAVKVMAPQLATSATARRRFVREARAAAAVRDEHVVNIHAVEDAGPLPYLVVEYISGISLQDRLDRDGPLQVPEILRIGMQAAAGLAAAHSQGLIHRDVKPSNILLENGVERVKLTDFGLARAADDASLTRSGTIAGTPQYMAPEQARGEAVDHRADLFSLGSVLYAMCTGCAPFRASGTMAVLKRVCEEDPRPIREVAPETPDWLIAVIAKLQAKIPADRFQSAAEVAESLGQYLAHVQQPALVPLLSPISLVPPSVKTERAPQVKGRRRRWATAAAVFVALVAGLATTEATGVTQVRATIIRLFTPDGTLVVETDDPDVKVTVEGDGGFVVTGAGLQEIRLRPSSYRVQADRDGKRVQLDRELVTVSRGGREIVRVKLEAPAASPAAVVEKGAFVVLAAGKERKFDTLAEAVLGTSEGDTIEIRGNGPFVSDGVSIRHPLVIRAGEGYTPSITLAQGSADRNVPLLDISVPLVLEGLELRRMGGVINIVGDRTPFLLTARHGGSLHVANCRLIFKAEPPQGDVGHLFDTTVNSISVRNSILSGNADGTSWRYASGGRCNIENCVSAVGGIGFSSSDREVRDVSIRVRGNTLVGNCLTLVTFGKLTLPVEDEATPPIHLEFSGNVARWDPTTRNNGFLYFARFLKEPVSAVQAEAFLLRLVRLDETQNVYQAGTPMLRLVADWQSLGGKRGHDLADWDRFWSQKDTGSVEGEIRFQGGDLVTRARTASERLTAEDFRLRPASAGYRAGKDGKDLGADVDLVGPGPAYERWKKTPDYQQWLKETGQVKK
jgi:serine/threonine protein kinase